MTDLSKIVDTTPAEGPAPTPPKEYPPAGFGVELEFGSGRYRNEDLAKWRTGGGEDETTEEGKRKADDKRKRYQQGAQIFKGTAFTVRKGDKVLGPKTAGDWDLTAEHGGGGQNEDNTFYDTVKGEIVINGRQVKLTASDGKALPETQDKAVSLGNEILDFYINWGDKTETADGKSTISFDKDALAKLRLTIKPDDQDSPEEKAKKAAIFNGVGDWKVEQTAGLFSANFLVHVTTAMPIAYLVRKSKTASNGSLAPVFTDQKDDKDRGPNEFPKPLETVRFPFLKDRVDFGDKYIFSQDKIRNPNRQVLRADANSYTVPDDFLAFITLCSVYADRASNLPRTNGPKEAMCLVPRNDFVSLFHHVNGDSVMSHFIAPYNQSIAALVAINLELTPNDEFEGKSFKWGVAPGSEADNDLPVKTWLEFLYHKNPEERGDLLTIMDSKEYLGDSSIGRLGNKWESVGGDKTVPAPIWEFRFPMKNIALKSLPEELRALNNAFWDLGFPDKWSPNSNKGGAKDKEPLWKKAAKDAGLLDSPQPGPNPKPSPDSGSTDPVEAMRQALTKLKDEALAKAAQYKLEKEQSEKLVAELKDKLSKVDGSAGNVAELLKQIEKLKQEKKELESGGAGADVEDLKRQIMALEVKLESQTTLASQAEAYQDEITDLQEQLASAEESANKLPDLTKQITQLEIDLEKAVASGQDTADLQAEVVDLQEQLKASEESSKTNALEKTELTHERDRLAVTTLDFKARHQFVTAKLNHNDRVASRIKVRTDQAKMGSQDVTTQLTEAFERWNNETGEQGEFPKAYLTGVWVSDDGGPFQPQTLQFEAEIFRDNVSSGFKYKPKGEELEVGIDFHRRLLMPYHDDDVSSIIKNLTREHRTKALTFQCTPSVGMNPWAVGPGLYDFAHFADLEYLATISAITFDFASKDGRWSALMGITVDYAGRDSIKNVVPGEISRSETFRLSPTERIVAADIRGDSDLKGVKALRLWTSEGNNFGFDFEPDRETTNIWQGPAPVPGFVLKGFWGAYTQQFDRLGLVWGLDSSSAESKAQEFAPRYADLNKVWRSFADKYKDRQYVLSEIAGVPFDDPRYDIRHPLDAINEKDFPTTVEFSAADNDFYGITTYYRDDTIPVPMQVVPGPLDKFTKFKFAPKDYSKIVGVTISSVFSERGKSKAAPVRVTFHGSNGKFFQAKGTNDIWVDPMLMAKDAPPVVFAVAPQGWSFRGFACQIGPDDYNGILSLAVLWGKDDDLPIQP